MKKKLTKFLVLILCLPTLLFCACKNDIANLPSINMSRYYSSTAKTQLYKEDLTGKLNLSDMTASKPNKDTLAPYTKITLPGNLAWLYKMYIECISFYVYTNESSESEMIINISISNLADESDRSKPSTFTDSVSFKPTKDGSALCTVYVNKVIANATDPNSDNIVIDILNSTNGTVADGLGNLTSFKWTIYDLKVYGESRTYSN